MGLAIRVRPLPLDRNDLANWPSLGLRQTQGEIQHSFEWWLTHANGERIVVPYSPRLVTTDMVALRASAMAGIGVVFPSRRGLLPKVRALIDFLSYVYQSFEE